MEYLNCEFESWILFLYFSKQPYEKEIERLLYAKLLCYGCNVKYISLELYGHVQTNHSKHFWKHVYTFFHV